MDDLKSRKKSRLNNKAATDEVRKKLRDASNKLWEDPEYRERHKNAMNSQKTKEKLSLLAREQWKDPNFRELITKTMKEVRLHQVFPKKDTDIEIKLQKALENKNIDFITHYPVTGQPDITFINQKVAVFCDGCYWHGCPTCGFDAPNPHRDAEVNSTLKNKGWKVLRFWGHEIKGDVEECVKRIEMVM